MNGQFALDKGNAKMMGVCAGLARWADVDPTATRLGAVLLALCLGPIALILYFATGFIANNG